LVFHAHFVNWGALQTSVVIDL